MKSLTKKQSAFVEKVHSVYAGVEGDLILSRKEIQEIADNHGFKPPHWLYQNAELRVSRGMYLVPSNDGVVKSAKTPEAISVPVGQDEQMVGYHAVADSVQEDRDVPVHVIEQDQVNYVPEKNPMYVKFGNYNILNTVVKSKKFFPIFITGLSGNGKTMGVEQSCAANKREYIPVSITIETDESDLIGDLTLENGNIKWVDGPVITAMKRGAVLLLDEIDLASNKIMSLQSIIDGKGIFLKKIKKFIEPAPGFTVVATANTKGKGSEDGRFIGTNILNEAFLERFKVTLEQEYPTPTVEKKILAKVFEEFGVDDNEYIEKLTNWSDIIRKSFAEGAIDEIITTRRLVHIAETYSIFKDRVQSIELCTNRFDDAVKESFLTLYTNLDENAENGSDEGSEELTASDPSDPMQDQIDNWNDTSSFSPAAGNNNPWGN